jgi:hypothetical protein
MITSVAINHIHGCQRKREINMESSINAINLSNQQFWKKRQARIDALMEDECIFSWATRRIYESSAYVKSAGSRAEMIDRIRQQKSFEKGIEDAAASTGRRS